MHDARMLREQVDLLRDGLRRRGALDGLAPVIDRGIRLERDRRTLIQAVEERKAARNANSQEVARRKRAKEDADELIAQGRALGDEITKLEHELAAVEAGSRPDAARDSQRHAAERSRGRRDEERHRA